MRFQYFFNHWIWVYESHLSQQSFEFSMGILHSNKCYCILLFQNICLFSSKNQPYSHEVTTVHSTVAESGHSCLCSCLCSRSCLRTCSHNRSNMVLRDWKVTFTGLGIHIHSKDMRAGHIALLIHTYIYIYIHTTSCTAQSIKMKRGCK